MNSTHSRGTYEAAFEGLGMFSLQKLLGSGDKFFDLFEASAQHCCTCVEKLKELIGNPTSEDALKGLRDARFENKHITETIGEMVVRTFVTVLEREDIEALAGAIYKIPKPLEKFAERFSIVSQIAHGDHFSAHMEVLDAATSTVLRMVKELRKGVNLAKIKALNTRLQQAEAEADHLELKILKDLYVNNKDPLKAIVMRDLYDLLEKGVDRSRDTGNVITHIFLKNS